MSRFNFLLALFLCAHLTTFAEEDRPVPLKVLFIGNSYTGANNLPAMVEAMADATGGQGIQTERHLVGGSTLERHVQEKEAIDKIRAEKWDVVVLQEQSLRPVIDREAMHKYARLLDAEIKRQGAKTVFYLTWARQHIPDMQEGADPATSTDYARAMHQIGKAAKTADFDTWCQHQQVGLQGGLNGAYLDIAHELGAKVAPVGIAWKKALKADPSFVLHRPDKSHPNPKGTYLAACVFYATLLDADPVGLPSELKRGDKVLASVTDDEAKWLQEIAWDSVVEIDGKRSVDGATYINPVGTTPIHMGDPFVIQYEGRYYLLLVKERADGLWTLPGGWADVNESPREAVVREIMEESGFQTRAIKLLAVWDRAKHPHTPPYPYHIYKICILCELAGGEAATSHETEEVRFFSEDGLPELSISRVTPGQIARLFEHHRNPDLPTDLD